MAIDFSWLITALQNIAGNINSFFSSIWGSIEQIVNVGQGIFAGLANFGGWIYQGLVDSFNWIWKGLSDFGNSVLEGFINIANGIYNAFSWIGTQVFNFGQWLWSGIQGFANMVVNGFIYVMNAVYDFLVTASNTIWTFIVGFKTSVDQWWGNMMVSIRSKLKQSIMFSVTTDIAWKSAQSIPSKLMSSRSIGEMGTGFIGALGGLIVAPFAGYIMSEMLDVLIPTPTSTIYKVAPDFGEFSLTAPSLEAQAPMPPSPSSPGELVVGFGTTLSTSRITMTGISKLGFGTIIRTVETEDIEENPLSVSPTIEPELTLI